MPRKSEGFCFRTCEFVVGAESDLVTLEDEAGTGFRISRSCVMEPASCASSLSQLVCESEVVYPVRSASLSSVVPLASLRAGTCVVPYCE